jgi:two-component system, NtrC family, nitrogen regulation response regulator NtrX
MAADILIVDDEADIRDLMAGILSDEGFLTRVAADSDACLQSICERRPALVVLDIWLQGSKLDGLELLDCIKRDFPEIAVVMISGHGNIETAVSAIKRGAYDYIEKPFKADRLILIVKRALEAMRLRRENDELTLRVGGEPELVGSSPVICQVRQVIDKVAATGSRVLISGAAGSGKEMVARLIHLRSRRAENPFVVINAATIAPERMEHELFGVEEGADGPEGPRKIGVFEEAHGGTLLLDEVGDMPLETQNKILRVLVEQSFHRVGGTTRVEVDVRVISATSRDLRTAISEGRFREDLYHRLNVVPVRVPSLAERREDIPTLVGHFMARLSQSSGLAMRVIGDDAMAALQAYDWPGNVRQLRNNIERLLILASDEPGAVISAEKLPPDVGFASLPSAYGNGHEPLIAMPLREAREFFEREYLSAQISRFGGNISRTAAFIGMERSALHRKLKSLGVGTNQRSQEFDA